MDCEKDCETQGVYSRMIRICPRCNQRFITENNTLDFEHTCNSGVNAIDQEDVVKTGDWTDFTGSGEVNNPMMQGAENKLWGTRADIEGEDLDELTDRGKSAETHRSRQHLHFIKLKGGGQT